MTADDLFGAARERCLEAEIPDWALRKASERLAADERGRSPQVLVTDAIQEAGFYARELPEQGADDVPGEAGRSLLGTTPLASLTASQLWSAVRPQIRDLRRRIWDDTDAPFESAADAEEWLDSLPRVRERVPLEQDAKRREEIFQRLSRLTDELSELEGVSWGYQAYPVDLVYRSQGGRRVQFPVSQHHPTDVWDLASTTQRLARVTGFDQDQVVSHTLLGETPPLPRVRMSRRIETSRIGRRFVRTEVLVQFLSPDVRLKELEKVYELLQRTWNVQSRTRLTEADALLHEILQATDGFELDPKPHGFWGGVSQRWKAAVDERGDSELEDYSDDPHALAMRADRLEQKLQEIPSPLLGLDL